MIATRPELAFHEIEGFGPQANSHSICHVDDALLAKTAVNALVANPGPIVIGPIQGASCFGPADKFASSWTKNCRTMGFATAS
ncbi:MAG: hypothetical protein GY789_21590 [Hyphomicrobiales bacterium]|nr:hypothetical protein [Hyphomicrobiales bacterium]